MRVLILTDESFASRERSMLSRLEVGLVDDGIRVIHGMPRKAAAWHHPEVFSQFVEYESKGSALSRGWRVRQVLRSLEELTDGDGSPADVIHCFGQGCWGFGSELAGLTGASLAIELWCAELVGQSVRIRSTRGRTQGDSSGRAGAGGIQTPVYFVSDPALERAVRTQDPNLQMRLTPWGVHTPGQALSILTPDRTVSVMLIGSGRDPAAINAALQGIAQVAARHDEIMVFADGAVIRAAGSWTTVRKLGLLGRFTLIPDMEARRELGLRADILLMPEARGEQRSLLLDAMAHGMLVIAATDPLCSALSDGRTARLVDKPTADRWSAALGWALDDRDNARSLAWGGREHVRLNRRASSYVASVVDAYEWMSAGEAIPFAMR